MEKRRVFAIVLDSCGCGALPDADQFGDCGSHTLKAVFDSGKLDIPNLRKLGLFDIDGIGCGIPCGEPQAAYCKCAEESAGKDTTTGHWELAGLISTRPMPTFPHGFPDEVIEKIEACTGRRVLCNLPYSGTAVIRDYGKEHLETGALIVYTSADSVLQIAAHEEVIPPEQLWKICEDTRKIMCGEYNVGRIIARPFVGEYPDFTRTANRHDYSVAPFAPTMLDVLKDTGHDVIAVGKISDIFAGRGLTEALRTVSNEDGMAKTLEIAKTRDFNGLCFVNLVEFDSAFGHRNDVIGYANALNAFDRQLGELLANLRETDVLILTADHGCDPSTESTDHSREYIPMLITGKQVMPQNLGVRSSFADFAQTVCDIFGVDAAQLAGTSFWNEIGVK